jgi:hypothetical protein
MTNDQEPGTNDQVGTDVDAGNQRLAIRGWDGSRIFGQWTVSTDRLKLMQILPPRHNDVDALAVETMLSALTYHRPFSLEITAGNGEQRFLVRADEQTMHYLRSQLSRSYPQAELQELDVAQYPFFDPAHARPTIEGDEEWTGMVELRLARAPYLPLKTYRDEDFVEADPIVNLLGAMDGLEKDERLLAQIILRPARDAWSKQWQGAAQDVNRELRHTSAGAMLSGCLLIVMALAGSTTLALAFIWLIEGRQLLALGVCLLAGLVELGLFRLRDDAAVKADPRLVQEKVHGAGYETWLRLIAFGTDERRVRGLLQNLVAAYRQFNMAGGNSFIPYPVEGDPADIHSDPLAWRLPWGRMVRPPWCRLPILNVRELASLWHLPLGGGGKVQSVERSQVTRLLPLTAMVDGVIEVGRAVHQGREVTVRLPRSALDGNVGLVAKTRQGKSNLMQLIVHQVIEMGDMAVVVIDPHGDLARGVMRNVPLGKQEKVVYIDLADRHHPVGLNLLDARQGVSRDQLVRFSDKMAGELHALARLSDRVVSDMLRGMSKVWTDYWGPRMEDFLRWPLLTLAEANVAIAAQAAFREFARRAYDTADVILPEVRRGAMGTGSALPGESLASLGRMVRRYEALARPRADAGLIALYEQVGRHLEMLSGILPQLKSPTRLAAPGELHVDFETLLRVMTDLHGVLQAARRYHVLAPGWPDEPRQLTILEVPALYRNQRFRMHVRYWVDDPEIHRWWVEQFETLERENVRFLNEAINPVLTKLNRFSASPVARSIFGQHDSTLDLAEAIYRQGIVVVNLAAKLVGEDTAALVGSTLLDYLGSIFYAQAGETRRERRRQALVVIDEFQVMPGADYVGFLSELAKFGARFVMGTQSLARLDTIHPELKPAWFANMEGLFVFQTSAEDGEYLVQELGEDLVSVTDVIHLPRYECYVRVATEKGPLPAFSLHTSKAPDGDPATEEAIVGWSRARYARPRAVVERDREEFVQKVLSIRGLDAFRRGLVDETQRKEENGSEQQPAGGSLPVDLGAVQGAPHPTTQAPVARREMLPGLDGAGDGPPGDKKRGSRGKG